MRILVTGSRDWADLAVVAYALTETAILALDVTVVHGGARGADTLAGHAADTLGWLTEVYRPDWDTYGRGAGFVRNQMMVDLGADACLAFLMPCTKPGCWLHDSHGATDCVNRAIQADIPVRRYRP